MQARRREIVARAGLAALIVVGVLLLLGPFLLYPIQRLAGPTSRATIDSMTLTITQTYEPAPGVAVRKVTKSITIHWTDDAGRTVGGYYDALHTASPVSPFNLPSGCRSTPLLFTRQATISFALHGQTVETWTQPNCSAYVLVRGVPYMWWPLDAHFPESQIIQQFYDSFRHGPDVFAGCADRRCATGRLWRSSLSWRRPSRQSVLEPVVNFRADGSPDGASDR
jgi:hypothetical protein